MNRRHAFTLIEISIAVFILLLLILVAVPSLSGVMADRRLHRSFDAINRLVRAAQERSVSEHRPYLLVWEKKGIALRPEAPSKEESAKPAASDTMTFQRGETFRISLPAALATEPPPEWVFWASGTCEPAVIDYKGVDGAWTATYSALTARGDLTKYGR